MTKSEPPNQEHVHEAVTHAHEHYHLTHNFLEHTGVFEHLGFRHHHEHAHAADRHAHYPHENFESEHATEAHDHPHGAQVATAGTVKRPAAVKRVAAAKPTAARAGSKDVTAAQSPGSSDRTKRAAAPSKAAPQSTGGGA